jgi:hypothetical protein
VAQRLWKACSRSISPGWEFVEQQKFLATAKQVAARADLAYTPQPGVLIRQTSSRQVGNLTPPDARPETKATLTPRELVRLVERRLVILKVRRQNAILSDVRHLSLEVFHSARPDKQAGGRREVPAGHTLLFNQRQRHTQLAELAVLDRTGYLITMLSNSKT